MIALGERGGVGVGNLLNAISLVLYRYVNHDNVLAGHVDVANGLATDRNLTLRGNGVTAAIAMRTDLARATTDTTISFVLAEVPSSPYLIVTARGPIEAPSFSAVRGPAPDPPGVFDKLPRLPQRDDLGLHRLIRLRTPSRRRDSVGRWHAGDDGGQPDKLHRRR